MISRFLAVFALVAAFFIPAVAQAEQIVPQSAAQMQMSFSPLVKRTSPAVVNIYTKRVVRRQMNPLFNDPFFNQFFGGGRMGGFAQDRVEKSLGSGVIISADGRVATNTHVISGATEIVVVTSDGREFSAEKMVEDPRSDLAVLKLDLKGATLPWLELADSDAVEVGDIVLAIGNPFGVGQTVTSGIVSGVARTVAGPSDYNYFIQTDAAINPGNSGGALVDMNGKLVGINSMIFSKDGGGSVGIGFAIPSSMLQTVVDAASHGGKIVRPWTGLQGQPVTVDMVANLGLQRAQGALINRVNPRGPAAKAGVKAGDVILTVNGRDVADPEALKYRLATVPLGAPIKLQLVRDSKLTEATMVAEAPPEDPPRQETLLKGLNPLSGATVVNISPAVAEELGGTSREQGVAVLSAEEGNAGRLGLSRGDIVLGVNGEKINSVKDLKGVLEGHDSRRWSIQVLRGEQVMNLMITI